MNELIKAINELKKEECYHSVLLPEGEIRHR